MKADKLATFFEGQEFNCEEKSAEEIKKYLMDENLTELQRIRQLLKSGDVLQKSAIYGNLNQYHAWTHSDGAVIFNELMGELKKQNSDTQVEAATSIKCLIQESTEVGEHGKNAITEKEKDSIFEMIMWMVKQKQTDVINEWIGVLDAFLSALDFKKYEKTISEEFFKLSGITSMSLHKATSLRILGILLKVKQGKISQEMIEIAKLFSQTAESEIKQRLLKDVLESIFKYLPADQLDKIWNDKLLEFLSDNNSAVKCEAIAITSRVLDKLTEQFKSSNIKSLFFDLTSSKSTEVKLTLSRYIGPFVVNLRSEIESKPANISAVMMLLQEYCDSSKSEFRMNFLYNLPGILQIFGKRIWTQISKQYYTMLTKDEVQEVRVQAVQIYLHIIEFVGSAEFRNLIRPHMRSILSSQEEMTAPKAAYTKLLPHIFEIYKLESSGKPPKVFFSDMIKDLVEILETSLTSPNWRFLHDLISLIASNYALFDPSEIVDLYIPVIFQAVLKGTAQVRQAALDALIKCISSAVTKQDREAIVLYMSNNFYLARSHHTKRMYLGLVAFLIEKYDGQYIRGFKFINVCNYHSDRVIAIRKELSQLLFPLYFAVTHPHDKECYNKLIEAFKYLLQDKDQEIRELLEKTKSDICSEDAGFGEKIRTYSGGNGYKEESKSCSLLPEDNDSDFFPKRSQDKQSTSNKIIGSQPNIPLMTKKNSTTSTSTSSSTNTVQRANLTSNSTLATKGSSSLSMIPGSSSSSSQVKALGNSKPVNGGTSTSSNSGVSGSLYPKKPASISDGTKVAATGMSSATKPGLVKPASTSVNNGNGPAVKPIVGKPSSSTSSVLKK